MTKKEAINLAKGAAAFLYQENPEHFEGGCSDNSEVIAAFLRDLGVTVNVVYGHAKAQVKPFRHAWLDILGERFDPTLWIFYNDKGLKFFRYEVKPRVRSFLYCHDFDDPEEMSYQIQSLKEAYEAGQLKPDRPELIEEHQPEED